jgi:ribose-phosphate pyrophosphokinase
MIVVGGSASAKLASRVARLARCERLRVETKRFPDGELYVRLGRRHISGCVAVIQSTGPPQDTNLMELLLLLDAVRDLGASRVTAVVPYLAYSRQDKRFKPGEAVSLRTVAKLIASAGADELVTLDIHEEHSLRDFSIPVRHLTAMHLLGEHLARRKLRDPVVIGADQGSEGRARAVAEPLGAPHDYLVKRRVTPTRVLTEPKEIDVRGRDVVIADDIISTGGTILEAARILRRRGARRVLAVCTHGVFAGGALGRLRRSGIRVVATDTIEGPASSVSVAPLIADAIRG